MKIEQYSDDLIVKKFIFDFQVHKMQKSRKRMWIGMKMVGFDFKKFLNLLEILLKKLL